MVRGLATAARRAVTRTLPSLLLAIGMTGAVAANASAVADRFGSTALAASQETLIGSFSNSGATVTVTKRVSGTGQDRLATYIADLVFTDATALRAAFAKGTLSKTNKEAVSTMAKANNAAFAVNCDWSGFRMNGIVIRNGKTYLDVGKRPGFVINRDGSAALYDETKTTAAKMLTAGAWQTISFGPWLVQDGQIPSGTATYEIGDFGPVQPGGRGSMQGIHPRAGIGYVAKNHFLLVGVDGYPENGTQSRGLTVTEFAQLFVDLGAKQAYNFDGGGSWTMYLNGQVVNVPGDAGNKERLVGDILYLAK